MPSSLIQPLQSTLGYNDCSKNMKLQTLGKKATHLRIIKHRKAWQLYSSSIPTFLKQKWTCYLLIFKFQVISIDFPQKVKDLTFILLPIPLPSDTLPISPQSQYMQYIIQCLPYQKLEMLFIAKPCGLLQLLFISYGFVFLRLVLTNIIIVITTTTMTISFSSLYSYE